MQSSIISGNDASNLFVFNNDSAFSGGYNLVADTGYTFLVATDQDSITPALLALEPLAYEGGNTRTRIPTPWSIAFNAGKPSDHSNAQNLPTNGQRDVGAAEFPCNTYQSITEVACDSFTSPSGILYSTPGSFVFSDTLPTSLGCDSVFMIDLTIYASDSTVSAVTSCGSYLWPVNNVLLDSSGVYDTSFVTSSGCDSTIVLVLEILAASDTTLVVETCDSYQVPSGDTVYSQPGLYTIEDTILNAAGCDSILHIQLQLNASDTVLQSETACSEFFWSVTDSLYTASGIYTALFANVSGCDSLHILDLYINPIYDDTVAETTCDSYYWSITDSTYFSTGFYTYMGSSVEGCDSNTTLQLTINASQSTQLSISACDSFLLPSGTMWIVGAGNYNLLDTLTTGYGCDSILLIDLSIYETESATDTIVACGSYAWPAAGQSYFSSGIYQVVFQNTNGCDSVRFLDLTIHPLYNQQTQLVACDSFYWQTTATTYYASGIYNALFPSQYGCDSLVEIDLTIVSIDTSVTKISDSLSANYTGASYQWLSCDQGYDTIAGATEQGFRPVVSGAYAVAINDQGCMDTSGCRWVTPVGIESSSIHQDNFRVYPNPASEMVIVSNEGEESFQVELLNTIGQSIWTRSGKDTLRIDIFDLPSGVYMLELCNGKACRRVKLVVQR